MNDLIAFSYEKMPVRTVKIDGQAWFVGIDVCEMLEFKNASNAMKYHCRGVEKFYPIPDSRGRLQDTRIINQADVLRLITNSTLPAAMKIEAWIFEEVIPSVLSTGSYTIGQNLTLPGSKRPMLPEYQPEIERFKAENEEFKTDHDLVLGQFLLETIEITGKLKDSIQIDSAYKAYCQFSANPMPISDFGEAVSTSYIVNCRINFDGKRLIKCKFKEALLVV